MALYSPSEQVIAATIVGTCTLTATFIKIYVDGRAASSTAKAAKAAKAAQRQAREKRPPRSRPLLAVGVGAGLGSIAVVGALSMGLVPGFTNGAEHLIRSAAGVAGTITPGTATAAAAQPGMAVGLESWLRARSLAIHYRVADMLPGACPGDPVAYGNWEAGASRTGVPVLCVDSEWIALDLEPLVLAGRVVRNLTYCVTFSDGLGGWGRHAALGAPGFDAIAIPATRLPVGRAIGFRIVKQGETDRVVLTSEMPRVTC